jgi:peroxiredoxin
MLLAGLALAAGAAPESVDWGPPTGSSLPPGLTATAQDGETVALDALSGEHGLVIAFVRSADWCPFCQRQLIELSQRAGDFEKRGMRLVALSYDSTAILGAFAAEHDIAFTLLSDPQSAVIDAFGIRNTQYAPGTSGYGIPHPGIVVFDEDGHLIAKFAEKSYRKRPRIDAVLAAVDALRTPVAP